jgi:hypothetical protein
MLRKSLWLVFSLFPIFSIAAVFVARDLPVSRLLLSAGMPILFNHMVRGWKLKCAWAGSNLLFYPLVPPIYALVSIDNGVTGA